MTPKEKLYLMGKIVTCTEVLVKERKGKDTLWNDPNEPGQCVFNFGSKYKVPFAGWVTGFRTVYSGKTTYYSGGGYSYFDGPSEGDWIFEPNVQHNIVLVTRWPSMKPWHVPVDAIELGGIPQHPNKDDEISIARQSEEAKNYERDAKGRFACYPMRYYTPSY